VKYLPRVLAILSCGALLLLADDFWKKPYTDWTEKDAAKLLENSPWAHTISLTFGGSGGGGGGTRQRGGGTMGEAEGGVSGVGGRSAGGSRGGNEVMDRSASVTFLIRWQSAVPVRQAMIVTQLGREKMESEDAKKFLSQAVTEYVVGIIGVQAGLAKMPTDKLNEFAKTSTSLVIKDKDPIAAEGAKVEASTKPNMADIYFFFPKSKEITLDDKEVEFVSKLGRIEIRRKFKLKEIMVGDKLAL